MTSLEKLHAVGCRVDGLAWDERGNLIFRATNARGPWSEADRAKVLQALGRLVGP